MAEHVIELFVGVDAAAVNGHAGPLLREPLVGLVEMQFGAHHVQQVLGVGPVVDRKRRRQADGFTETVQQPGRDGVIGAAPDRRGAGPPEPAEEVLRPAEHIGRRPAGERQEQNAARIDALGDQPGHAMDQGGGLAGAGAGHDQQRPFAMRGRRPLLRIQLGQQFIDGYGAAHGDFFWFFSGDCRRGRRR